MREFVYFRSREKLSDTKSIEEQLEDILKSYKLHGGIWPNTMPPVPWDAAMWWIGRQEPRKPYEKTQRILVVDHKEKTERYRIADPYTDHMTITLRKFLRLPAPEQRIILAAWEDGIFWRGEDTEHRWPQFNGRTLFENIIHETEIMRAIGVGNYREESRMKARNVIKEKITQTGMM